MLALNIDRILGLGATTELGAILLKVRMSLLLGYYADMLFIKYESAFIKVMDFLLESLSLSGKQKVVALQSADTLNTIISDKDLIPRLEPHLPRLIKVLNECNKKINIKLYFSFLQDFVKFYNGAIGEDVISIVDSLVSRILAELKNCHEKGERNNIIINKCWNVLRLICELDNFMPVFSSAIEETLKPLFEFMVDPAKVEFEDDIVLTIKSFIKKCGGISPVIWALYPHLYKVFEKNKLTFGNLLDTLNHYLITGRDVIAQNREYLVMLIKMAGEAMFSKEPTISVHNSEGAILMQLIFQVYAGTQVLDEHFDEILGLVQQRMKSAPM